MEGRRGTAPDVPSHTSRKAQDQRAWGAGEEVQGKSRWEVGKKVQGSYVLILTPISFDAQLKRKLFNISDIAIKGDYYSFKNKHSHSGSPRTHSLFHSIS